MNNEPNKKLLNGCTSILEMHSNKIHHNISLVGDYSPFYSLKCNNPSEITYDDNKYSVATFKNFDNLGFNFALKFDIHTITPKRVSYDLTDANLRIFFLNDNKSQLLFRAEFATNGIGQLHAQPHWQFEPYITKAIKESDYDSIIELRDDEIKLLDFQQQKHTTPNIAKIHFAMTSDWHKPHNEQTENFFQVKINDDNVVCWLDGCMKYIEHQIAML